MVGEAKNPAISHEPVMAGIASFVVGAYDRKRLEYRKVTSEIPLPESGFAGCKN